MRVDLIKGKVLRSLNMGISSRDLWGGHEGTGNRRHPVARAGQ